jgi:hypothetical protein
MENQPLILGIVRFAGITFLAAHRMRTIAPNQLSPTPARMQFDEDSQAFAIQWFGLWQLALSLIDPPRLKSAAARLA